MESALIHQIARSHIYDLAQPIDRQMPVHHTHPPYLLSLMRRYGDYVRDGSCSGATEIIMMSGHHSTHIDAPGHMSVNGHLHGGVSAAETAKGGAGLRSHGIDQVLPVVTRGVLLDVPLVLGRMLEAGEPIEARHLAAAADAADVAIEPGDAVLIRTGWIRHWTDPHTFSGETGGSPGPVLEAAKWLVQEGMQLTGSDTMVYELTTPNTSALPVHGYLLVDEGISIMEMLNLEELARDRVYEFLFVVAPLRLIGGTGSPIRPLALT